MAGTSRAAISRGRSLSDCDPSDRAHVAVMTFSRAVLALDARSRTVVVGPGQMPQHDREGVFLWWHATRSGLTALLCNLDGGLELKALLHFEGPHEEAEIAAAIEEFAQILDGTLRLPAFLCTPVGWGDAPVLLEVAVAVFVLD